MSIDKAKQDIAQQLVVLLSKRAEIDEQIIAARSALGVLQQIEEPAPENDNG